MELDLHRRLAESGSDPSSNSPLSRYSPGTFIPFEGHACSPESERVLEPHALCKHCENIREVTRNRRTLQFEITPWNQSLTLPHFASLAELKLSARRGCHLCCLLVTDITGNDDGTYSAAIFRDILRQGKTEFNIRLGIPQRQGGHDWLQRISLYYDHEFPGLSNAMSISTASRSALTWGQQKLTDCFKNHLACHYRPGKLIDFMPTRILRIGFDDDAKDLFLVSPKGDGIEPQRYAALSYCWGSTPSLKLTATTLASFRIGIPRASLPKTYRDAIEVCCFLGIRYLWVDALCILQDSEEDWARESNMMAQVYQTAHVTLAALGASNNSQGCFAIRNTLMYEPCILDHNIHEGYISLKLDPDMIFHGQVFDHASLFSRGWAFQERILSPRTLYFGELLVWECQKELASELNEPIFASGFHLKTMIPAIVDSDEAKGREAQIIALPNMWKSIVEKYTSSNLTFIKDRLAAITGIISLIRERTGLDSVAGFWLLTPRDLLWTTTGVFGQSSLNKTNDRAPSWSWLSVDCKVAWNMYIPPDSTKDLCTLKKPVTKRSVAKDCTTYVSADLHLSGSVHCIKEIWNSTLRPNDMFENSSFQILVDGFDAAYADRISLDHWPTKLIDYTFVNESNELQSGAHCSADAITTPTAGTPFHGRSLPFFRQLYFLPIQRSGKRYQGLILYPADMPNPGRRYLRVGVMEFFIRGKGLQPQVQRQDIVII